MKKQVLKELQKMAASLPPKLTARPHTERFTAEEIREYRKEHHPDDPMPKLRDDKSYPVTTTTAFEVNHLNVMKVLYKNGGMEAVKKYVDGHSNSVS